MLISSELSFNETKNVSSYNKGLNSKRKIKFQKLINPHA